MGDIYFDFAQSDTLAGMAPAPLPGGGFTNAALPAGLHGGGMYVIYNHFTQNRYIGISVDLAQRFAGRMSVVTELGFDHHTMGNILIWWGTAAVRNTGGLLAAPLGHYGGPLIGVVDGANINLEHLLIRYVLGNFGGTVSNNVYAFQPIINPTHNAISIHFSSCHNALFNLYQDVHVWPAGHQI